MPSGRVISYLRVSTTKQGGSGLGLEAQRAAVAAYLNGGSWMLDGEFVEVESGRKADDRRPELANALEMCRLTGSTLVFAKLDRLSRDVHFISGLMKIGIPFVAADFPDSDPFMLHIRASVAEDEARRIAGRTKAALAEAKKKGTKLGGWRGGPKVYRSLPIEDRPRIGTHVAALGAEARRNQADEFAAGVAPMLLRMKSEGASLRVMAARLTEKGVRTHAAGPGRRRR